MFCRYCGNKLSDNDNFCAKCGKAIDNVPISTNDNNITEEETMAETTTDAPIIETTAKKSDFFNPNTLCFICNKKTGLNKNYTKRGYICFSCLSTLNLEGINLLNINKYPVNELKDKVSNQSINNTQALPTNKAFCCPKCKGTDIDLISTDKNMKTKKTTSLNLNPLKPFTIFNHNEKQKEKASAGKLALGFMTGGTSLLVTGTKNKKHTEYFCRNCGYKWIGK